jgi:hypothetical protein
VKPVTFLVLLAVMSGSCETPTITGDQRAEAVARLASEVYVPGYQEFERTAQALAEAVGTACADGDDFSAVDTALAETEAAWLATSAFRFGPADEDRLDNDVSYPIDEAKVTEAAMTSDPATVSSLGSDTRGLDAIALILSGDDPRQACPYLTGAAGVVVAAAAAIVAAWTGESGFAENISTEMGSQDAVEMAVNGLTVALDDLVFFRLSPDVLADGQPAWRRAHAVAQSVETAYEGGSRGLASLVEIVSSGTGERTSELAVTLTAQTGSQSSDALTTATELRRTIATEVSSLLSATLLLGDADGDA